MNSRSPLLYSGLELGLNLDIERPHIPSQLQFESWVKAALGPETAGAAQPQLCLSVVSNDHIQQLNRQYRDKDAPTNVLSFPCELPNGVPITHLGDIVIAADVVEAEAQVQAKNLQAHWAHMVVHATLHLLGYDHEQEQEAEQMEGLETQYLEQLGYANPYET